MVGIGASAGGLDAFKRFFGAVPGPTGLAFVLVQHLDPTRQSLMADVLARYTDMPVVQVEGEMRVEPDHVYVIPPDRYLTIDGGILRLSKPPERRGMRMPIDFFLVSLAEDLRTRAIGIILSGTASDGTLGIRAVKAHGGVTLAQDPVTARYDGMPRSAIATGMVDHVLPVGQMPDVLVGNLRRFQVRGGTGPEAEIDRAADHLDTIVRIIRGRTRHDLGQYRKGTLIRRIERRMGAHRIREMSQYAQLLLRDPVEVDALFKDLLINTTSFFREPDAFAYLEERIIPELVRAASAQRPIRVWVPGCSTGEEPYSVAMLLAEQVEIGGRGCSIQVFATDIDEEALETARAGVYPATIAADVSPERLQRFFARQTDAYRVSRRLRETVVFAPQNLVDDPPFSKMDLVVCRNLLIYLEPQVQNKMVGFLHFALNVGGYLFLGNSEAPATQQDLFEAVSSKWRVYRRLPPHRHTSVEFPLLAPGRKRDRSMAPAPPRPPPPGDLLRRFLVDNYAPAAALVNRSGDVVFLHGATDEFLRLPGGEPTRDLLAMVPQAWRIKLRAVLHRAGRTGKPGSASGLSPDGGRMASVRATVTPLQAGAARGLLVVAFEHARERSANRAGEATSEESVAARLETSHEEVMSMNEELQSSNEELETSKEELQSLNEELGTLNSQLQEKVQELEAANTDLANILASTDVATLFLDRAFRIKRYTPAVTELLRLIPADVGRPLSDITWSFSDPDLLDDAARVLDREVAVEREVQAGRKWYLRRALPYRSLRNEVDGVVVTFADVTALKTVSREVEARSRQRQVVAELGRLALGGIGAQPLMQQAVESVAGVLGVDYAEVMELLPDGSFLVRAGQGWREGYVGTATLGAGDDSLAGHALESNQPLVVGAVSAEGGLGLGPLLSDHPVASSARVPIRTIQRAFGVLGVDTVRTRSFGSDDVAFLQAVAGVLAQAVERRLFEERLESLNRSLEQRVAERTTHLKILLDAAVIANRATSPDTALRDVIARTCAGLGWPLGHVYVRPEGSEEFRDAGIWTAPDQERFQALVASRRQRSYRAGEGLVGRAAAERVPLHLPDPGEDDGLREACAAGLVRAACAVPVLAGDDVVAVLEFLGSGRIEADQELLGVLAQIGAQLGQVVERKAAEHERRRFEQRLRQTQKLESLGVLAGGIAHDFNNLLTGVLGSANLARASLPEGSPASSSLATIVDTSKKLAGLTQQLLAYAGKGRFLLQRVRLSDVLEDLKPLLSLSVSKDCDLRFQLQDAPPIEADLAQLRQVVMNLVINASEAIGPHPGVVAIENGERTCDRDFLAGAYLGEELPEGTYASLEVRDNGEGMTPEVLPRIFDPFFTTKFTGRGLGLAAVLGIVRAHKGAVQVTSSAGEGTTFRMLFPAAAGPPEPVAPQPEPEEDWHAEGTVLVADDEEVVRDVAGSILEAAGFTPLVARDGPEALSLFQQHAGTVGAVLLDLTMPNLSAEQTFDRLRTLDPSVPVVICSGYTEHEVSTRFAGRHISGFLQKPFLLGDVVGMLKRVMKPAR